jgi:hypothetical protein
MSVPEVIIGFSKTEQIRIRAASARWTSDGWLEVEVVVSVQGFRGKEYIFFYRHDLVAFEAGLAELAEMKTRSATLRTMENQLELDFAMSDTGLIRIKGVLSSDDGSNRLNFTYQVDQTLLPPLLAGIREFLNMPVKAN